MNRRTVLIGLGATGLGMAGAAAWRLYDNHVFSAAEGPAYLPWADWQQEGPSPWERLIRAAVLAANPHNSQPWKFRLFDAGVDVYADTSRRIGAIDPLLREMHLGIGCAIENLLLAAEASGYRWSFDTAGSCDDPKLQPVLRILLKEGTKRPSDLYAAIPRRHTDRGPYATRMEVDPRAIAALDNLKNSDSDLRVFWFQNTRDMRAFADLVISATEAIIADRTVREQRSMDKDQLDRHPTLARWPDLRGPRAFSEYANACEVPAPAQRETGESILAKCDSKRSSGHSQRVWHDSHSRCARCEATA